jgi:catechol 2,3-dioxygenase-like lactoylglutathione lyase family enzyme
MQPNGILETCLYVDDLRVAERFYRTVLGLEFVDRQEGRHVFFRCGSHMLLLFDAAATSREGSDVPSHGARGPAHIAFAADEQALDQWRVHLEANAVEIERVVDWPHGGRSLYFRDPAGNSLELATPRIWTQLESGTGDTRTDR